MDAVCERLTIRVFLTMANIKPATRPREVIYFIPVQLNTVSDGKVYMFMIMDAYSEFMFQAGSERGDDMEYVLKQIQLLMSNKDFSRHGGQPFTLVMSDYEEYRNEIEDIIKPHGGKMLVDKEYVNREMAPVVDSFLSIMAKNRK